MASMPVSAVICAGTERINSGSTMARSASMKRLCTAILLRVAGSVTSARVPTSLPVPAVVAIGCEAARDGHRRIETRHIGLRRDVTEHGDVAGQAEQSDAASVEAAGDHECPP